MKPHIGVFCQEVLVSNRFLTERARKFQIRWPLHTSFLLMAIGNCFYFCAQFVPTGSLLPIMMAARFLVGAGQGELLSFSMVSTGEASHIKAAWDILDDFCSSGTKLISLHSFCYSRL